MKTAVLAALTVAALLTLDGCASVDMTARDRFARQYRCAEEVVRVEDLGGEAYRVRGCGRVAVYSCTVTSIDLLVGRTVCRTERAE